MELGTRNAAGWGRAVLGAGGELGRDNAALGKGVCLKGFGSGRKTSDTADNH